MNNTLALVLLLCLLAATICSAQDAVKADSEHYSVVLENDHLRVLDIHYGPNPPRRTRSLLVRLLTSLRGQRWCLGR